MADPTIAHDDLVDKTEVQSVQDLTDMAKGEEVPSECGGGYQYDPPFSFIYLGDKWLNITRYTAAQQAHIRQMFYEVVADLQEEDPESFTENFSFPPNS